MAKESLRSGCAPTRIIQTPLVLRAAVAVLMVGWVPYKAPGQGTEEMPSQAASPHLVVVRLSADGINGLLARRIDVKLDVDEEILDARVTGKAHVVGRPDLRFVASDAQAMFHVMLQGTAVSRTVGTRGAAVVRGSSETTFTAIRPVVFEPGKGFRGLETVITAKTRYVTDGVSTRTEAEQETGTTRGVVGRVLQRRAAQRLEQNGPQAAEIARTRAERRIREAVERRIDQRLSRLNWFMRALAPLTSEDGQPLLTCCSTPECVVIGLRGSRAVAAAWPQVSLTEPAAPVEIWFHRSLFDGRRSLPSHAARGQMTEDGSSLTVGARVLDALAGVMVSQTEFTIRREGDWNIAAFGRSDRDSVHLAQQPSDRLPR